MNENRNRAFLFYGSGTGFSGQRFALELVAQGLQDCGWQVKTVTTPLRDRVKSQNRVLLILEILNLISRLLMAWIQGVWAIFTGDVTVISPGQTKFALIRDGLPLLVTGFFTNAPPVVLSLHGNLITYWTPTCFEAKLLRKMVQAAKFIAILGPTQKAQLIRLGIPDSKIITIDNTCSISPITASQLKKNIYPLQLSKFCI